MFWFRLERCFIIENVLHVKMFNKSINKMIKQFLINKIVYRSQFWNDFICKTIDMHFLMFWLFRIYSLIMIDDFKMRTFEKSICMKIVLQTFFIKIRIMILFNFRYYFSTYRYYDFFSYSIFSKIIFQT